MAQSSEATKGSPSLGERYLPVGFVCGNANCHRKIETANRPWHGHGHALASEFLSKRSGETARFAAEEKPVAGLIPGSGVGLGGKLGKDPKPIRWDLRQKMIPRIGSLPLKVLPIVETCPLQLLLVHSETSRANDPQFGIQCRAGAADIPRVLWNLGLVQNDVQDRIGGHGRRDVTLRSS